MGLHVWGVGGGRCEQVEAANCDIPPFSPPHLDERQARALHRLPGSVHAVDGHHDPAVSAHHLQGGAHSTQNAQGGLTLAFTTHWDGGARGRLRTPSLPPTRTLLRPPPPHTHTHTWNMSSAVEAALMASTWSGLPQGTGRFWASKAWPSRSRTWKGEVKCECECVCVWGGGGYGRQMHGPHAG